MRTARSCDRHNLWFAHSPTLSRDGTLVYLVCGCGQPRQVPRAQWQAEEARRQQRQPGSSSHPVLSV